MFRRPTSGLFIGLLILPFLAGIAAPSLAACADTDKPCLWRQMTDHPTRKMAFWKDFFAKPVAERIFIAPPLVIKYLDLDNRINGFPNKPFAPSPSAAFRRDVRDALQTIPEAVKRLVAAKFAGIFLVGDLGGTGFSDTIRDDDGNPAAGFIVLDTGALDRTANQWASWKEQSPFRQSGPYRIKATIEPPAGDNRKNAIQYILLHELGHVVSTGAAFHPPWDMAAKDLKDAAKYPYFNESWIVAPGEDEAAKKFVSKYDAAFFGDRRNVTYYFGAKLDGDQSLGVYDALERTNFVTLYGATQPGDDFAEAFVTYVHGVLMKKPFAITITKDGKVEKTFGLCWGTPRCARKEAILADLFGPR